MISVMIIDNDALFCAGLEKALSQKVQILGEASSGARGLALLRQVKRKPEVVLLNAQLPDMSGERLCRMIHRQWPRICFIFLLSAVHWPTLSRLVELPAQGFLTKEACYCSVEAIKTVYAGRTYLQPDLAIELLHYRANASVRRLEILSAREYEILVLLAREKTHEEITELMRVNIKTVYNLKMSAFKKLGFSNQMCWRPLIVSGYALPENPSPSTDIPLTTER